MLNLNHERVISKHIRNSNKYLYLRLALKFVDKTNLYSYIKLINILKY
jgi:hypothetical protein